MALSVTTQPRSRIIGVTDSNPGTITGVTSANPTNISGVTTAPNYGGSLADGNAYLYGNGSMQYGSTSAPDGGVVAGVNTGNQQSAPSGGTGGAVAPPPPVLDRAAVNNTQATIDQIPALLEAALAAEAQRYENLRAEFNAQEQAQRGTYGTSTITNQKNYDSNMMDSVRAGAKGLGGLMQILRGTGAEGWARDTVGSQTSRDIRDGFDTQSENQTALDDSLGSFLSQLKGKRQESDDTLENNRRVARNNANTQLQELYGKMAGYYGDAEMTPQRETWMSKAGDLTPAIARDSMAKVSSYDRTPVSVKAPDITAFAGPTQKDIGYDANGSQIGSGIFTMDDRRRDRRQEQTAPLEA